MFIFIQIHLIYHKTLLDALKIFITNMKKRKEVVLGKIPFCDSFMECRFSRIRIERSFGPYRIELIVISSELDNELPLKVRPCSYKPHNRLL